MINCAPNFRELGGAPAADGKTVRYGRLFRSDLIRHPTAEDAVRLGECGIALVFDLRSSSEVAREPNIYFRSLGAEILEFNIGSDVKARGTFWDQLASDCSPDTVLALVHRIYRAIPIAVAPAMKVLFERIDRGAPPLLLHCTAGKDRTGIAAALLLHVLGVPRDVILADYLETQTRLSPETIERSKQSLRDVAGQIVPEQSLALLAGVRQDFLEQSFGWIERKYGTPDNFLREKAGLDEGRQARIRATLLETSRTNRTQGRNS